MIQLRYFSTKSFAQDLYSIIMDMEYEIWERYVWTRSHSNSLVWGLTFSEIAKDLLGLARNIAPWFLIRRAVIQDVTSLTSIVLCFRFFIKAGNEGIIVNKG